jgi:hypothetical protein
MYGWVGGGNQTYDPTVKLYPVDLYTRANSVEKPRFVQRLGYARPAPHDITALRQHFITYVPSLNVLERLPLQLYAVVVSPSYEPAALSTYAQIQFLPFSRDSCLVGLGNCACDPLGDSCMGQQGSLLWPTVSHKYVDLC